MERKKSIKKVVSREKLGSLQELEKPKPEILKKETKAKRKEKKEMELKDYKPVESVVEGEPKNLVGSPSLPAHLQLVDDMMKKYGLGKYAKR